MRILVTDGMDKQAMAKLREAGHEVVEQFYEIGDAKLFLDAGDVIDVECDDIHADGLGHDAQMLADAAETDDTEGLALKLDALAVGLLFPLARAEAHRRRDRGHYHQF